MIHDTVIINKITADEGKILTNGKAYGKEVYLGKNDCPENWHEITEEEYRALIEEEVKE